MRYDIPKATLRCLALLSVLVLLPSPPAAAEESKQLGPFSLQDCITTAMQNNIDVLTGRNNVAAAKSRSTSARSGYLPQVSVQNNTFAWGSGDVLSKTTTGTALTVSQNIFDGGVREANVLGARYGVIDSSAGLTRTLQAVSFNVSKAYYEVLRARHLALVAEANVKYNEGLRDQVQARADVGDAAKVDVLPVEAQLAGARVQLLSSQNAVRTAIIELQSTMGLRSQPGFDIEEVNGLPAAEIEALESYMASAVKSRPDIVQAEAAVGSAHASVKSSKITLYPRPTVSAQYQRQVSGGFTTSGGQVVGGISFDIFDGGANRAAYREARAGQANAELQAQQLDKDIRAQVEEAYLNLTNAGERVAASAASLEAANRNYSAQIERYEQGLGTTLDLLNAEVQVVTAESDNVQARYDYYIAIAQMDYAMGKPGGGYES